MCASVVTGSQMLIYARTRLHKQVIYVCIGCNWFTDATSACALNGLLDRKGKSTRY